MLEVDVWGGHGGNAEVGKAATASEVEYKSETFIGERDQTQDAGKVYLLYCT